MQNIDFSNKRALVIDNSSLVRSSTVANLSKLGFSHIKGSNGSSRALELVAADDYDLVLLGHSTTERNSGLQLLEKARHKNLIKPTACWGFMSGDNSPEVIIHASESEPDFVISKPFTLKQLQDRLQSAMARKQAVKPINQALDGGDIARALEFCDFVLDKNLSILSVKQKKADLLLHSQHFEEALALFEEVASLAPHNNIDLKICEAMIGCSRLEQAEERLDALIAKSPLLIKAYDLQASLYEKSGRLEESMQVLNRAMNISSMAISRNMKLGKLAIYTGKTEIAASAFKRTIQLNTGSCHRTPEPYLGLANIQRESLKNDGDQEKIEKEIDVLLKEALTAFPDNAGLKVQIALFKSKLQDDLNNPEGAVQFRELAEKILFLNNLKDDIEQLNQSALTIVPEYEAILSKDSEEEEQSKGSQPEMSNKVNLQGIKQYLSKNRAKAIKYFTMSLELDRENGTALLNLAQVYLESMHDDEAERDKSQRMVKRYLGLVENLNKTEPQQTRFSQLKEYVSGGLENMPKGSLGMLLR